MSEHVHDAHDHHHHNPWADPEGVYGIVAEFSDEHKLMEAAQKVKDAGYGRVEAYTPFPIHGLADILGPEDHRPKWIIFVAGVIGAFTGYSLQWWVSEFAYPHNVGGKPLQSWVAFIPVSFECMILFASIGAVVGMLALNGLPRPHHPIFNTPNFDRASQDGFFLCVEAEDEKFSAGETMKFFSTLGADHVSEVQHG